MKFKDQVPAGFTTPTALPQSPEQSRKWQDANRSWWESHPMRYDWKEGVEPEEYSREFYVEIDRRFFSAAEEFMPWNEIPFDSLIDFAALKDQDVLEIGVGNGSHAQLLAQNAHSFTGIDLTEYAVKSTCERMRRFGLNATILRMDAEQMQFDDNSFDFIWTWGVIHHSSDIRKVLQEMARVLKPGGRAITMVYHRNLYNYYLRGGLFYGLLQGDLFRTGSIHQVIQLHTDGAIARFYSIPEWKQLISEFLVLDEIRIFGTKAEVVLLPGGKIKDGVVGLIPNSFGRFVTNRCKLGSYLVSALGKRHPL